MTNLERLIEEQDIRITPQVARDFGGCINGWKTFAELNNLDFKEFLSKGILASALYNTEDETAKKIIYFAYTGVKP